jgi:hypothetical protein
LKKIVGFVLSLAIIFSVFSPVGASTALAATPLKGAYSQGIFYANGGRVNIEANYLYLNVNDARTYASKCDISLYESTAWFAVSFIPASSSYIGILGFLATINSGQLASDIRSYTDKNIPVRVTVARDNFNGLVSKSVIAWDGNAESVKYPDEFNTAYRTSESMIYKP